MTLHYIFPHAVFVFMLTTNYANASCSGTTGVMSIDVGTISIPVDSPNSVETFYYNQTNVAPQNVATNADLLCSTSSFTFAGHIHNSVPETNDLEKLMLIDGNWSGLGIKFYNNSLPGWYTTLNMLSPPSSVQGGWNKYCFTSDCWHNNGDMSVIQSGSIGITGGGSRIKPAPFNTRINAVYTADGYDAMDFIISGVIVTPSCTVDSSSPKQVNLEEIHVIDLEKKGSTAKETAFNIQLNCSGDTDVSLLLDGQEDADASGQGVLAINKGAQMASGVGIQLLFNNSPAELGKDFPVGHATEGAFTIPMTARYFKTTATPVKPGNVVTAVVYILTYY